MDDPYDPGKIYKGDPNSYPSFNCDKDKLKELINEVLDERMKKAVPYESEEWLYRGTY